MSPIVLFVLFGCSDSEKTSIEEGGTESSDSGSFEVDEDGDGLSVEDGDCDDQDASIPSEERCDGVDNDCDGDIDEPDALDVLIWFLDEDGDGFGTSDFVTESCEQPQGYVENDDDCLDSDEDVFPQADEIWYDGIDSDCDGNSDFDQDGDGQDSSLYGGMDCDDANDVIYVGAFDTWYDGIDSDCDGSSDFDQDGDGQDAFDYGGLDCNDEDPDINTAATEIWYDGIDQNCDNANDYDSDEDGLDDRIVDLSETPQFIMELHPIGNSSNNALQGLAIDVEQDELWMSVDSSVIFENVLINRLSLQSGNPQYCENYTEGNNLGLGHGQDLSIEYASNGERLLWIGSQSDRGVTRVDFDSTSTEVLSELLPSGWSHSTPAIGLKNQWVAVRGSKDGDESNNDWIRIYDKVAIESGFSSGISPAPLYSFNVAPQQRVEEMWFQGLALDEEAGVVYALTGNSSLSQPDKLLYVYDLSGNVITSTTIGMDWSAADAMGSKYEPEGLSLVQDPVSHIRYLYFTMMFGGAGNNMKRLYSIAPASIHTGGSYSNNDIDWLIRYNTLSGAVSISSAVQNGKLGCETKRTTWSQGWSRFVGYYADGDPHLLLQKEIEGTIKIHPLDWEADLGSATKNSTWSTGWSNFHAWEHAGESYVLYYKSGSSYSGAMKTQKLTGGGNTGTVYEEEYWSTGWNTHIYTLPNGDDYLLRYMSSNQNLRLASLTSGYIGPDLYNDTWNVGVELFGSVQKDATTYVFTLDQMGVLESFAVQSNGLLTSSDSISTVLTDWSTVIGYQLEGRSIVHLYRASDGFFTLYEVDGNGLWEGPVESGFEELGWTSIQHFRTTP